MDNQQAMTSQENQTLLRGEALNAAVAQYVMEYKPIFDSILGELWLVEEGTEPVDTPPFAASPDEARTVIGQIRARKLDEAFLRNLAQLQQVTIVLESGTPDVDGYLDRHQPTPEQICQAALLTVRRSAE